MWGNKLQPRKRKHKSKEQAKEQFFQHWCHFLGLIPEDNLELYDWVGNMNGLDHSDWSHFFELGKDYYGGCGIYCLTIYNPKQATLATVIYSNGY